MGEALTLNGLRVVRGRLLHPWKGAWIVDAELDPDAVSDAPTSGVAIVVMGGATLTGTVDPRGTGSFASQATVRVVGGAGGWDKTVPRQHYHLDNGVTSTSVYTGAAALVGESVVEAAPVVLGPDFMRAMGPASRVFADGVDWYLDLTGVTQVGPRPVAVADSSLNLLFWDPLQQRAELTCDALVLPNTVLSDPRLNGAAPTVRDVEQVFDASGSHVVAWCAVNAVTRLVSALQNMVREYGRTATLKTYLYRIVLEGSDGRVQLQAVNPSSGMPDTLPVSVWPGMHGDSATYQPSTNVLVHFVENAAGLPPQPVVIGFAPTGIPIKRTVDAQTELDLGPSTALVAIAGGGGPLVPSAWATALVSALITFTTGLNPTSLAAQGAALLTALGLLPPDATTRTTAT